MRLSGVLYESGGPVEKTRARALAVNEILREPLSAYLKDQQTNRRVSAAIALGGVLLGILGIVFGIGITFGGTMIVGGLIFGAAGFLYTNTQTPDITVTGIEKGYWTGYTIPDRDGIVVYDATASVEPTIFELERLTNEHAITSARDRLESIEEFPVVMPREENIEEELTTTLDELRSEIENAERDTVRAPIVPASGPEADAIEFAAKKAEESDIVPVDVEIEESTAKADVEALAELERMAAADEGEAELETLSDQSRQIARELSTVQETAIERLNDHIGTAADAFGLVSYNFYCPDCQTEEIDSIVELADPQAGEWYCESCRSHHETEDLVPRHRIKDDLVNPIWDQLWIEKDDQRRQIYENIEDQKQELQEREFEQRREEIRSTTDRIRDLRSRIRDLKTEAKAAQGKVEEIGDLLVKYDRINERRKEEFEQDVEEAFVEIDQETERILEETRNEEQKRIDEAEKAAKEKAEMIREEERRRQIEMYMAAQERADQRTEAQMRQRAELHDEELELEKQHHRENWMLKTRERMSFSGHINKSKMRKDRMLGASAHNAGGKS